MLQGEFVWHSHVDTDELFLIVDGTLTIQMRDGATESKAPAKRWLGCCRRGTQPMGETAESTSEPARTDTVSGTMRFGITVRL